MKRFLLMFVASVILAQSVERWTLDSGGSSDIGYSLGQTTQGNATALGDSATFGYWHPDWEPVICVTLPIDTWFVSDESSGDTIPVGSTVTMISDDMLTAINCGNAPVDLGLRYVDSDVDSFTVGYYPGYNKGVIRAQLRDDEIRPLVYDTARDYLKNVITWATADIFGSGGFEIGVDESENLWFQFASPYYLSGASSAFEMTMTVELAARYSIP